MRFEKSTCSNLAIARRKEWLETNGLGGFATSTIVGLNTRRYHGLLVAAIRPPVGRMVLLSKLEETLLIGDRAYELSVNQYPGAIHPSGHLFQVGFRLEPFPTFEYAVEDIGLEKSIFMIHQEDSAVIRYRLLGGPRKDVSLEIRPLVAFRDYHALTRLNDGLDEQLQQGPGWVAVRPYSGFPTLYFNHDGGQLLPGGNWYRNFEYEEERLRGLDWVEDLFNPFGLRLKLGDRLVGLIASTSRHDATRLEELSATEIARRERLVVGWEGTDGLIQTLLRAADQFIVRRGEKLSTIIAGYPWFADWGRDAMIAFTGLVLVPRRFDVARKILLTLARYGDRGMLPNRFPDAGEVPEYNTVDATLWFFQAIFAYATYTGDYAFVHKHLYPTLLDILQWHVRGTRFNIRMDDDGLLNAGEPGVQLTWMDARVGEEVITPRMGKPVEIQALWFNALKVTEHFSRQFGEPENEKRYADLGARVRRSFNQKFWNAKESCLYDGVADDVPDTAMRPNQILAVSLPFSMLSRSRMKGVVDAVTRELLTPFGLRSLTPKDPRYQGVYTGDQNRRDRAYHQGTVWTWLMGPYITARVRVDGSTARARQAAAGLLRTMHEHLEDAGLGTVSEIFDGDAPYEPRGCIAQAWSVAEWLRALVEDLAESMPGRKPRHQESSADLAEAQQGAG
ncbi:MAG: glycogen debranching enzyme N-terminal domain-containing protein [Acidobacteria bacterium]|nr:glycogen debranching enzyme N-terminal domain-containing protein [Acidobacteriota bacterium]